MLVVADAWTNGGIGAFEFARRKDRADVRRTIASAVALASSA
jgi:hypothetical protein